MVPRVVEVCKAKRKHKLVCGRWMSRIRVIKYDFFSFFI